MRPDRSSWWHLASRVGSALLLAALAPGHGPVAAAQPVVPGDNGGDSNGHPSYVVRGVSSTTPAPPPVEVESGGLVVPPPPGATIIKFDDQSAPCLFTQTMPLRDRYASLGVVFS